ncbi:hypothetical protein ACFCV9_00275 [Streptomyces sp. NPDC056367]|uniref:hypothetical protein n=1 Tax=Streptomyces sp. NPDC056367 TaxID=3345797 RepID=UPI0035E2BCD0
MKHLHEAAQHDRLATSGLYARVRHPQYDGLLLLMTGFLLQWPTVPTLVFPVLVLPGKAGRRRMEDAGSAV